MPRRIPPDECGTTEEANAFWGAMDDARDEANDQRRDAEDDAR